MVEHKPNDSLLIFVIFAEDVLLLVMENAEATEYKPANTLTVLYIEI